MTSVVVVGGGASAVCMAIALEECAVPGPDRPSITVVSREGDVGRGVAYGRAAPHHRLNSPASAMSMMPSDPSDFVRWCATQNTPVEPGAYVERTRFGAYVQETYGRLVARAGGRVRTIAGEAIDIEQGDAGLRVRLANDAVVPADAVVLAVGNPPPATWRTRAALQIDDPWAPGALEQIPAGASVLLIGTGLTMIDVATVLARREDNIRLTATSRHLEVPRVHSTSVVEPGPGLDIRARSLGALMREFHRQLEHAHDTHVPWQSIVDGIRPHVMEHWQMLGDADRGRFLDHVARRWDVHRHRMAPAVAAELQTLIDAGVLSYGRDVDSAAFDAVVFCNGPAAVSAPGWNPLIDALLRSGAMVSDGLGLGPMANTSGALLRADGVPQQRLFAIGHALRGALWETTAIGEIRILANRIAAAALGAYER